MAHVVECENDRPPIAQSDIKPISQCVSSTIERVTKLRPDPEQDRKAAEWESQQELRRRRSMFDAVCRSAGERYRQCRLDNFEHKTASQSAVLSAVCEYSDSLPERMKRGESLILYGGVGTGKDHLAFSVVYQAVRHLGWSVDWIKGIDWYGKLRDAIGEGRDEESSIAGVGKSQLAVLSDPLPPVGSLTQYQSAMLYRAIERRYSEAKLTIVTLNVSSDSEADDRLGAPTWDRMCHNAWKIACNWPSYRQPARELK